MVLLLLLPNCLPGLPVTYGWEIADPSAFHHAATVVSRGEPESRFPRRGQLRQLRRGCDGCDGRDGGADDGSLSS